MDIRARRLFSSVGLLLHFLSSFANSVDSPVCVCLQEVADNLQSPVRILQLNDGSDDFLIAEQRGIVSRYSLSKTPVEKNTFLDLATVAVSSDEHMEERGLLDVILHPNYENNSQVYVYYIGKIDSTDYATVSEIVVNPEGTNPPREQILLAIEQPTNKRNGGQMLFGSDGYLYISVGDGGVADDREDLAVAAQNKNSLLGKILRVDINKREVKHDRIQYYGIPSDNPFVNHSEWRPEIFAVGFRNPWRCGMDKANGITERLFCGDAGTSRWEEINMVISGGNYGWNLKEGSECLQPGYCDNIENEGLPIYVYNDTGPVAVVGGNVYRGSGITSLNGQYLFADAMMGKMFRLEETTTSHWTGASLLPVCSQSMCPCNARAKPGDHILSFGEDNNGEMYLLMTTGFEPNNEGGKAVKLVAPESSSHVTCGSTNVVNMLEFKTLILSLLLFLMATFSR